MRRGLAAWVLFLAAAGSGGCGTACNLAAGLRHPEDEPRVYGGVIRDMEIIEKVADGSINLSSNDPRVGLCIVAVGMLEPPLSFVGDTLTLPITVYAQEKRIAAKGESIRIGAWPAVPDTLERIDEFFLTGPVEHQVSNP